MVERPSPPQVCGEPRALKQVHPLDMPGYTERPFITS